MRVILPSILLVLTTVGALALAQDAPVPPEPEETRPGITALAFLAGNWAGTADDGKTWETFYTTPNGGEVLGVSKELRDGRVVMFEFERFVERDGALFVVPYPFGKAKNPFRLKSLDVERRVAVFEDPENDFPRTLTYARPTDDGLEIGLAGEMRGEPVHLAISLRRVAR